MIKCFDVAPWALLQGVRGPSDAQGVCMASCVEVTHFTGMLHAVLLRDSSWVSSYAPGTDCVCIPSSKESKQSMGAQLHPIHVHGHGTGCMEEWSLDPFPFRAGV